MTSALHVVARLRALDREGLEALLVARRVPTRGLASLLDVAEWLVDPAHIREAVAPHGWRWMHRMRANDPRLLDEAARLLLAFREERSTGSSDAAPTDAEPVLLPETVIALDALLGDDGSALTSLVGAVSGSATDAAEHAFSACSLAIDALWMLDSAPRPVRATRNGARMSGVEIRRIAAALDQSVDTVTAVYAWLARGGLMAPHGEDWAPTESGRAFASRSIGERWRVLAETWLDGVSPATRAMLVHGSATEPSAARATAVQASTPGHEPEPMTGAIPVVGGSVLSALAEASTLGALVDGRLTQVGALLLDDLVDEAVALLAPTFPAEIDGVYVQPDLSIVAPGPLRADLDARLRESADLEQRGIASTYRVSPQSISRALAAGRTIDEVTDFLRGISLTGLPQPVAYLLGESGARHGLVRVAPIDVESGRGAYVRSADEQLMRTMLVDQALSPLGLTVDEGRLRTRAPWEAAFWSLLDAKYPVAAEDRRGELVSLRRQPTATVRPKPVPEGTTKLVHALLDEVERTPAQDDATTWLQRQLELARRAKSFVRVVIALPDGGTQELDLRPTSVSAYRLRGRDAHADVERTVPIASIARVLPSPVS